MSNGQTGELKSVGPTVFCTGVVNGLGSLVRYNQGDKGSGEFEFSGPLIGC